MYGDPKFAFPYVPSHLHHMVFELVKNSLRAVQDKYEDEDEVPPPIRWGFTSKRSRGVRPGRVCRSRGMEQGGSEGSRGAQCGEGGANSGGVHKGMAGFQRHMRDSVITKDDK